MPGIRLASRKASGISPAEASELLSLSHLIKAEIDGALSHDPRALVTYIRIEGATAGVSSHIACATTTTSPIDTSGQLTLPKTDPRLAALQFVPRVMDLLNRLAGSRQHADLRSISTPTMVPLAGLDVQAEVWCCEGAVLQSILREAILGLIGHVSRFVVTADTQVEDLALTVVRVMRFEAQARTRLRAADPARSLHHWGVRPSKKSGKSRTQYEVGTSPNPHRTLVGKRHLYRALELAEEKGWIERVRGQGNTHTYRPTATGLAAASLAAFLTGLRQELLLRPVAIKGLERPRRRIVCHARAAGHKRARTWAEDVHPAPDEQPSPIRVRLAKRQQRRRSRQRRRQ